MPDYPPTLSALLAEVPTCGLGPGKPILSMHARLSSLRDEDLFGTSSIADRSAALCCRAGLWLAWDFLDESHSLSQEIDTREGSYWHALMHRREPDAWNSKYWFRKVGTHPIFELLSQDARDLHFPLGSDPWNPSRFIDLCEEHRDSGSELEAMLRRMQMREWERLFAWCFTRSVPG